MRMSGTKPMKNTMRKQPPTKMLGSKVKEAIKAAVAAKKAKSTETSAKTPPIQMKKYGMGKKC